MKLPLAQILCFAMAFANVCSAEGPDKETTAAAFEFAFIVFEDFRITPEIGVVYEPVFSERFGKRESTQVSEEYSDPTYKVLRESIFYDGLEIVLTRGVDDPPSGWTWLNRVRISSSRFNLRHGLRIGDTVEKFETILGPWSGKRSSNASKVSFYAGGFGEPGGMTHGAHATVTLHHDGEGVVTNIQIDYWAD